jgi:hypothetical protein
MIETRKVVGMPRSSFYKIIEDYPEVIYQMQSLESLIEPEIGRDYSQSH